MFNILVLNRNYLYNFINWSEGYEQVNRRDIVGVLFSRMLLSGGYCPDTAYFTY